MPTAPIRSFPRRRLGALLAAAALASAMGAATAAPFATSYTGVVAASGFTTVSPGDNYTVTLVFDNGGATAADQVWNLSHLTCAIWSFSLGNVQFVHNLTAAPPTGTGAAIATDAGGALVGFPTSLTATNIPPAYTSATAFTPALAADLGWDINTYNPFFHDAVNAITGNGGGVSVTPGDWSAPAPFNAPCPAPGLPPAPGANATPVPVLGLGGLTMLAGLLGAVGWRTRRKQGA